jgi:hypothetical protein
MVIAEVRQRQPTHQGTVHGHLLLAHDPEKWTPVFGKDHAPTKS